MTRTLTSKEELDANVAAIGVIDAKIAEIEAKYEAELRSAAEAINARKTAELAPLQSELNSFWEESEGYVKENRKELIPEGKTLALGSGSVFYRDTPGAVVLKSRKKNAVEVALEWLKKKFPKYVRTKPEIDREAILADYHEDPSIIIRLGEYFRIAGEERFYIRPVGLTHILVRTPGGAIKREQIGTSTSGKHKSKVA